MLRPITLPQMGLPALQADARAGGYTFVDGLVDEWASGAQRFDGPGELLCGFFDEDELIATGGLTRDPFVASPEIGRIRKVYVRSEYRGRGIGESIMRFLMARACRSFRVVRLRAENADAARLYERLGFEPISDRDATHRLGLAEETAG